jgi:hypothetical protein
VFTITYKGIERNKHDFVGQISHLVHRKGSLNTRAKRTYMEKCSVLVTYCYISERVVELKSFLAFIFC